MISVIIPVYNVKNYLGKCVQSVIEQTYKELEIILVDDGSVDGSGVLCDELQKQDQRIKVIHKTNGGLSDARNKGVNAASGEFVFFLDSDDWIHEKTLEILLDMLRKNNADIVVANYYYQYNTHRDRAVNLTEDLILSKEEAMETLLRNEIIKNFAWGKLYKRELLINHPFPVGKLFEDSYWTHLIFHQADKVALSKKELVFYYQRSDSISYTFDVKKLHLIEGYLCRREFVKKYYKQLLYLVDETIISLLLGLYMESLRNFQFKTHKIMKTKIIETSRKLKPEFNQNKNVNDKLLNQFNQFCKTPKIYALKIIACKIKGKI